MVHRVEVTVAPYKIDDEAFIYRMVASRLKLGTRPVPWKIVRRSIDARKKPVYKLLVEVYVDEAFPDVVPDFSEQFQKVDNAPEVMIVGAGPAGYFAALECIILGLKPIVWDRGKDVQARRRDLRAIQQFSEVNPDSNYCFGEGGAGTYSDGKLYTRSKKRGSVKRILEMLVFHGATEDILIDAHPHIGSNKLPRIIANIRESIVNYGGEVHFGKRLTDMQITASGEITGLTFNQNETVAARHVILATGHSARDVYSLLLKKRIRFDAKPFAMGVRIEHPQQMIDQMQYGRTPREEGLPAASYRLACEIGGRGVYSFCMCPGGLIVPAATAPGEIVVNGMSLSRRDSPFANSGLVTSVDAKQWVEHGFEGVMAGLKYQMMVEQSLFQYGDGSQSAPAQRVTDFITKRESASLPATSYIPGIYSAPLHALLPANLFKLLLQGLEVFGRRAKGYICDEAVVVGTESRTSAPIRIPRDPRFLNHPQVSGLYPCGEGGGYAGGIISAAIDGQLVAKAVADQVKSH